MGIRWSTKMWHKKLQMTGTMLSMIWIHDLWDSLHPPRTEIPSWLGSCCNVVIHLLLATSAQSYCHICVLDSNIIDLEPWTPYPIHILLILLSEGALSELQERGPLMCFYVRISMKQEFFLVRTLEQRSLLWWKTQAVESPNEPNIG